MSNNESPKTPSNLPADPSASPASTEALPTISKDRLRVLVAAALKSFRDAHGDSIAGGEFSSAVKRIAGALYTEFNGYGNETTTQSLKQKSAGEDRSQSTEATTERLATDGTKELLGQAIIGKHICAKCSNLAVWNYMPGEPDDYYCDDCVSRGCSCNYDPETNIEDVDQHGRKLPCCEYDHSLSGFDVADPPVDRVIAPRQPCEKYLDIYKVGNEWLKIPEGNVCPRCGFLKEEHRDRVIAPGEQEQEERPMRATLQPQLRAGESGPRDDHPGRFTIKEVIEQFDHAVRDSKITNGSEGIRARLIRRLELIPEAR